jgi:anti-sigma factor (TIGR02949 family)
MNGHENCRALLASLSDYIDGDLSEDLCAEIERHIAGCENCQVVVDTLKKTIYIYRTVSTRPSIPSEVRERLFHTLELDEYMSK